MTSPLSKRSSELSPFHVMDILAQAKALSQQGQTIYHMEVGEPDFPTAKCIVNAGIDALKQGKIKAQRIGRHYVIARTDVPGADLSDEGAQNFEPVQYYSVAEAARILGISRIAVFKKIQKGQMKAQKIGRSYAILKSELGLRHE